ncbi:hypothetical protein BMA3265 [Burkholderia mallei ATCC 23344]|uniref:Uncharacterized protein n=1 Tax=Burkholderia mallei (strain ATCC 23344) TaxID=243160 RepID=A0A0H2WH17_BURMA|nr:hypothetical protein BMA3265 [Burkholderia mallei ATCC 23344]
MSGGDALRRQSRWRPRLPPEETGGPHAAARFVSASGRRVRQRLPLGIDSPISPTSVATTPPAISMIVFVEGEPVKKRATPSLIEWNDWPPKYSSTTPPTMSATEIARVMKILAETDDEDAAV